MNKDGLVSSQMPGDDASLAHANSSMTCYSCHTFVDAYLFRLPSADDRQRAQPMLHTKFAHEKLHSYNFQFCATTLYMLGVRWHRTGPACPARSSCAVLVSSQNASRLAYTTRKPSRTGFFRQAFSTFVLTPSRERNQTVQRLPRLRAERQQCLDGAIMLQGTTS